MLHIFIYSSTNMLISLVKTIMYPNTTNFLVKSHSDLIKSTLHPGNIPNDKGFIDWWIVIIISQRILLISGINKGCY